MKKEETIMLKKICFFCCFIFLISITNASEKSNLSQEVKNFFIKYNTSIRNGNYLAYMTLQKGDAESFRHNNMIFKGLHQLLKIKQQLNDTKKWQTFLKKNPFSKNIIKKNIFNPENIIKINSPSHDQYIVLFKGGKDELKEIKLIKYNGNFFLDFKNFKENSTNLNECLAWSIKINELAKHILSYPTNYSLQENSNNHSTRNPFTNALLIHNFTNKSFIITNDNKVTVIGKNQQAFIQRFSFLVEFSNIIETSPKVKILQVTIKALENDFYREEFKDFVFKIMLSKNDNIIDINLDNNLSKGQLLALETLLEECFFPTPNRKLYNGSIWNTKKFKIKCKFYQRGFDNYFLENYYLNNKQRYAHLKAHENRMEISNKIVKNYSSKQAISLNLDTQTIENSDSHIIINTFTADRKILMKQHINVKFLGSTEKLKATFQSYFGTK